MCSLYWAAAVCVLAAAAAAPAAETGVTALEIAYVKTYMRKYGFTKELYGALADEGADSTALQDFQTMAGIPATGVIDRPTVEMTNKTRCGNQDRGDLSSIVKRRKRYATEGSRWQNQVTYFYLTSTQDLDSTDVEITIDRAFQVWSDVSQLKFYKVDSSTYADIVIKFAVGEHGDGIAFDGRGNVVGHTFYPKDGGDIHLDDDETWTLNSNSGVNLYQAMVHEIGHSLGLKHSDIQDAAMYAFTKDYDPQFKLHQDDINGIQHIYGAPPNTQRTTPKPQELQTTTTTSATSTTSAPATAQPPRTPAPTPSPDYCGDGRLNAITSYKNGYTYAFRGDRYYKIDDIGVRTTYLLTNILDRRTTSLDATLYWPGYEEFDNYIPERLFFIKNERVWEISDNDWKPVRHILELFPGLPNDLHLNPLDSAFLWSGNGRTYFTRGDQYYRVAYRPNSFGQYPVDSGYPRPMAVWSFDRVDAVFQYSNGRTYFFIDDYYFRYNDTQMRIEDGNPPYPRPTSYWWYGCRDDTGFLRSEVKDAQENDPWIYVPSRRSSSKDSSVIEMAHSGTSSTSIQGQLQITCQFMSLCVLMKLLK